jgi:membrane protease YdiL (CAAX protease family)
MLHSLPEFDHRFPPLPPEERASSGSPWGKLDLAVFGAFFALTVLFLPFGLISLMRVFEPNLQASDLQAVDLLIVQGVMDLVLVGFIAFLVKIVHRLSFTETIHWYRTHQFRTSFLISVGAALAVTVLIVSALFPPAQPPPIEKLISSTKSLYLFALFGIALAPVFEEIIFRGFLYRVFFDLAGASLAVPLTAGLFALLHVPQLWGSWAGILSIFAVGYILALLRARSNSLIPSVIVHTAYNGMLFAVYAVSTLVPKGTHT